jgi:hypothetical protein
VAVAVTLAIPVAAAMSVALFMARAGGRDDWGAADRFRLGCAGLPTGGRPGLVPGWAATPLLREDAGAAT